MSNTPFRGVAGARVRENDEGHAFDDMESDIDFDPAAPATVLDEGIAGQRFSTAKAQTSEFTEKCVKCQGRGTFTFGYIHRQTGQCFACKGKGYKAFKTSPDVRAQARAQAARSKAADLAEKMIAFLRDHKAESAWINEAADRGFSFAVSMIEAYSEFGNLTEGQLAAVRKCMAQDAERAVQRAAQVAAAPTVNTEALFAAFAKATEGGLKRPKMNFDGFVVSMAPVTGKNAGALYVKRPGEDGEYLGKIVGGKFLSTRECSDEVRAEVIKLIEDPKAASMAYGLRTGNCCICSRALTDAASVAAGIGPICAGRFF